MTSWDDLWTDLVFDLHLSIQVTVQRIGRTLQCLEPSLFLLQLLAQHLLMATQLLDVLITGTSILNRNRPIHSHKLKYYKIQWYKSFWRVPPPRQRLVDYSGGPPSKGWIAQMEEHWYGNPEVSGSSPSSVKFSLPIFQKNCLPVSSKKWIDVIIQLKKAAKTAKL